MKQPSRAVLTLALGPPFYLELATNLARSFLQWNHDAAISFHIITDQPVNLPPDLAGVQVLVVPTGRYGAGFSPKLWLDELAPADETLFLDSDCLCFGPLPPIFDRFAGRAVAVIGETRSAGHFFGEIVPLLETLKLPWMAAFVGSVYYLERGPAAHAVYEEARRLEKDYDRLGLIRLRGVPNEEPLMALALARFNLPPLADDGLIKADAMHYRRVRRIDVLAGKVCVDDPWPDKPVPPVARPIIFHFNSHFTEGRFYRRECRRLKLIRADGWPAWLATLFARLQHDWPALCYQRSKDFFRPLYRRFFGAREVRGGER